MLVWIWLLTTLVAVSVANAAVSSVRAAVTDTPAPLGLPEADRVSTTTSEVLDPMAPPATSTAGAAPTTAVDEANEPPPSSTPATSQPAPTTTTTTTTPATATPVTTAPATPPTSTTAAPAEGQIFTYDTDGGWVTVLVEGGEIRLEAAGPKQGWKVEIESSGPKEVVVKFERRSGKDEEIAFHATVEDGEPRVEIEH